MVAISPTWPWATRRNSNPSSSCSIAPRVVLGNDTDADRSATNNDAQAGLVSGAVPETTTTTTITAEPTRPLPATGSDSLSLIWLGLGLFTAGATFAITATRRRRTRLR